MDHKLLAIKLSKCETEDEIIQILKKEGLWDNEIYWRPFGDNENNFSTIGNQQSSPDAALVEKIINAIDAILMKDCLIKGIDPESSEAPNSIKEALEKFYNIENGEIRYMSIKDRNSLSKNIILAATGSSKNPCYVIADQGEGQTPDRMPDTILSLNKSNKLKVPFVQGKHNMGGTGVLQFCGKDNIQLIISKRCPSIKSDDPSANFWGFTIIRRQNPSNGRRSSMYTYLTDENKRIRRFKEPVLDIIPTTDDQYLGMDYGMFIKLFEYQIGRYKTNIQFNLNYRLAALMPSLAHPVRLVETRANYSGHTLETTLSGLNVRLSDDTGNNIEEKFPMSYVMNVNGQKFNTQIYLFKEETDASRYRDNEGIIFSLNGQTQGYIPKSFFKKENVGLSYLADSLILVVDCSNIEQRNVEDLFMNSRDRLRDGEFKKLLEDRFAKYLKENEVLRRIQDDRRKSAIFKKLSDEKPLIDVLDTLIKKSPTLSKLFIEGKQLSNPFNLTETGTTKDTYKGKLHPTYFKIKDKPKDSDLTKDVPINHGFRVKFETDVENNYFGRDSERGEYYLYCNDEKCDNHDMNLYNGIATLNAEIPEKYKIGDKLEFRIGIVDEYILDDFEQKFFINICKPLLNTNGKPGTRINPPKNEPGSGREAPSGLALPDIQEVSTEDYYRYNMTKEDALLVRSVDGETYDFFVNIDNIHLLTETKSLVKEKEKVDLTKAKYKYSMFLIGISILNYYKLNKETICDKNEDFDIENEIRDVTKMISPIIIPLIDSLSELNIDDIIGNKEIDKEPVMV